MRSFKDRATQAVFKGENPGGIYSGMLKVARRKLAMVDAAVKLNDLKSPPGNNLHELTDDRAGQHSIRVNDQYRVCFVWSDDGVTDVEITDYH
ncbi:MAG TPA: type II toxin-antitoxin system RelE/ParE family toxin [Xanthobacteraceae bacterium]|nr:type II toxin-antitoxin system RelE/ParE family toxin [Xanthobacteraceae bacterium]